MVLPIGGRNGDLILWGVSPPPIFSVTIYNYSFLNFVVLFQNSLADVRFLSYKYYAVRSV